ncbi:MAG: TonB-dependent receptor, partial [Gammaproteobacteria bacterium]|nr:TonB-dependent receptor [Gammaproteobacteria bacterium]
MINLNFKRLIGVILSCVLCHSVNAAGVLEEVVVTAQKREQNLQDVGIAVTAFSGDQTDALGWESTEDVAAQTPGLTATSFNGDSSVSFFVVRGLGQADFGDQHEAPTVVYVDGAYIANTGAAAVQLFDMERIETLKGPQGTLFGRNATGGLVHILNRKPTEEFEAYGDIEFAEYDSIRFEGAVSGPLGNSTQGRLSFLKHSADGFIENDIGPDLREQDDMSIRAQLQTDFSDRLSGHISFTYSTVDDINGGTYTPTFFGGDTADYNGFVPNSDPHKASVSPGGSLDKESYGVTGTLTYEINDDLTLTSITNYQDNKKFYFEDSDGSPFRQGEFFSDQDAQTFGQEIRLNGSTDRTNWVAGAYYLDLSGDYLSAFFFPDFVAFANITALPGSNFKQDTKSWALFGQVDYELTDALSVTAGVRYTEDKKDFDITGFCDSGPNPATGVALPVITGFGPGFDGLDGCTAFGVSGGLL